MVGGLPASPSMVEHSPDPWISLLVGYDGSEEIDQVVSVASSDSRSRSRSSSRRRWPTGSLLPRAPSQHDEVDVVSVGLETAWSSAVENIAISRLPIINLRGEDPKDSISTLMRRYGVAYLYIGATLDPVRRWLGCASGSRESAMTVHCERWGEMYLLAIAENSIGKPAAKVLETQLIQFALKEWPMKCKNKAADARGQCPGINFLYMVVDYGL